MIRGDGDAQAEAEILTQPTMIAIRPVSSGPAAGRDAVRVPASSFASPVLTGMLTKLGGSYGKWQKRYFVLDDLWLHYYKNAKAKEPKGSVDLVGCKAEFETAKKKKYCFRISHPDRPRIFYVTAKGEEERRQWVDAINRHISHFSGTPPPGRTNSTTSTLPEDSEYQTFSYKEYKKASSSSKSSPSSTTPATATKKGVLEGEEDAPKLYGSTLEGCMALQRETHPSMSVPRIVAVLCDALVAGDCGSVDGLFRVSADASQVSELKRHLDVQRYDAVSGIKDVHVLTNALKMWVRDLADPLIPMARYDEAISVAGDGPSALELCRALPEPYSATLMYLMRFFKELTRERYRAKTQMDAQNYAVVFGPQIFRCDDLSKSMMHSDYHKRFVESVLLAMEPDQGWPKAE